MTGEGERAVGMRAHRREVPRPWCIPPAMLRDPGDRLEGSGILEESSGDLGLLLWRTVRDVVLWAGTPADSRGCLFGDESATARLALLTAAELPEVIAASVDGLNAMLSGASGADDEIVALCCLEVAAWARQAGLARTAVAFAQAGALASPHFAEAAVHVGAYARAAGQDARAGTWLRRAVTLARRAREWPAYAGALAELGALYEDRGNAAEAERYYQWACRAGRRYAARSARMRASHGLFRLARRDGDASGAVQYALQGQRAYDPEAAGAPGLLLDLARFWTDRDEPARARAAVRRLWPSLHSLSRADQLAAAALAARALARPGGARKGGREATRTALRLMADLALPEEVRFRAARDLAHAARLADDLAAFTAAKRAALLLAPRAGFPDVADEMAKLWPAGEEPPPLERAS